ncbi:MAG TPA: M55 family metallopeptidase [Phycisphaerae bacterium]|nr:M55 family metallopeptidase [Phycisphaerae bacterium]HRY69446.1 M55 family metallopeptidase [Phycisphaerae bacterium]HSA26313.1 M55 family metallopeptidase [Phycisphaerae bacterium]
MNVFISADIEGICGVMAQTHWSADGADYKRACGWMVEEVNAAVEGAIEAGAKRIVVKDSHGPGTNIELERLHPSAELISGWGPLRSMVEGIDETFDVAFLVGYHARATTAGGTLAHTWSSNVMALEVNDKALGETGWAATFAGHFGVPVVMVTGDDKLVAQVKEELPEGVYTVMTKTGWGPNAARMRPIQQVRDEIRRTAAKAVLDAESIPPLKPGFPATLRIRFRNWEGLHACEAVPHVRRVDPQTFECRVADALEAQKYFATLHRLANT